MTPQVRIAAAALVRGGRILVGHRHPRRLNYPNCWDLIGGHIEAGESAADALRRECREEIGVEIQTFSPLALSNGDPQLDLSAFVVTDWTGEPTNRAPDEHDDLQWFGRDDLPGLALADAAYLPSLLALTTPDTSQG